ncbi:DNA repair protein REV1-like isoform X3 [Callithrix jacchus]
MESKLASLGIKTYGDLQYMTMAKLQKEFGPKTGQMLYRFCRGLDDRPVQTEKERKSVSAEINYGIRFTQVGIHVNQLVPADPNTSTCPSRPSIQSSHFPRGSHSVRDIFQVQKAMKSTEEEHKEELALSCHIFLHICRPVSVLILTRLSLQGNGMVCILLSVCSQDLTLV